MMYWWWIVRIGDVWGDLMMRAFGWAFEQQNVRAAERFNGYDREYVRRGGGALAVERWRKAVKSAEKAKESWRIIIHFTQLGQISY